MRGLFITLLVYCTLAICAISYFTVTNSRDMNSLRQEADHLQVQLDQAIALRRGANSTVVELEDHLRRERLELRGDQAIDSSLKVQDAQATLATAIADCNRLAALLEVANEKQQSTRSKYLPLVILLLLHFIGGMAALSFLKPKL